MFPAKNASNVNAWAVASLVPYCGCSTQCMAPSPSLTPASRCLAANGPSLFYLPCPMLPCASFFFSFFIPVKKIQLRHNLYESSCW